jgi:hypothetical protein
MLERVTPDFETMAKASRALGEHNDCTVKALTAATGLPYDVCHAAMAKFGRPNRKGCNWHSVGGKAAEYLGFKMTQLDYSRYNAKTMITAARDRNLRSGRYVVRVRGHVAALVDGKVIDWTAGRRHAIKAVYEIVEADRPMPAPVTTELPKGSAKWLAFAKYRKHDNLELF